MKKILAALWFTSVLLALLFVAHPVESQNATCARGEAPVNQPIRILPASSDQPDELSQRGTTYVSYYSRAAVTYLLAKHVDVLSSSEADADINGLQFILMALCPGRQCLADSALIVFSSESHCPVHDSENDVSLTLDGKEVWTSTATLSNRFRTNFVRVEESAAKFPPTLFAQVLAARSGQVRFGKFTKVLSDEDLRSMRDFIVAFTAYCSLPTAH